MAFSIRKALTGFRPARWIIEIIFQEIGAASQNDWCVICRQINPCGLRQAFVALPIMYSRC